MNPEDRTSRSAGVQFAVTIFVCAVVAVLYIAAMRALLDVSLIQAEGDIERRDEAYLVVHGGILLFAAILGFLLGKWMNGLGLAYSVLFVILTGLVMLTVLFGSYELACHGHNGLVRHWECGPP